MAHPSRPPASSYFSDSDEGEAPEEISVSASKMEIEKLDATLKNAQAHERQVKKRKNRELDQKLKERSEQNNARKRTKLSERPAKEKAESEDDSVAQQHDAEGLESALEARMRRAMLEAQDEEDENSEDVEFTGFPDRHSSNGSDSEQDDKLASTTGQTKPMPEAVDDQEAAVSEGDAASSRSKSKRSRLEIGLDHLPDEVFVAAFKSGQSSVKRKPVDEGTEAVKKKMRRRSRTTAKADGNRTIHVLARSDAPSIPSTTPSKKIRKFLDRTLALKNSAQHLRSKGWERKPVNIGIMKRDGPAAAFVRKS